MRVASALQTIGAAKLAAGEADDSDVLVAADDADAAAVVRDLLAELGLRSWQSGPLANSAAAEAMTSVLIQLNRRYKRVQSGLRITGKSRAEADAGAPAGVQIHPITGLPLFASGDDLAGAIAERIIAGGLTPEDGDVIVIAQKIASKVEDRARALADIELTAVGRDLSRQSGKPEALSEPDRR